MNREEIIRMAREAGFSEWAVQTPKDLERFAALVAAAERDSMCEQFNIPKKLAHEKAKSNEADRTAVLGKG